MSNFEEQEVVYRGELLEVKPGQTFAFVSVLGGRNIREKADRLFTLKGELGPRA